MFINYLTRQHTYLSVQLKFDYNLFKDTVSILQAI